MMACKNCLVVELQFEVQFQEKETIELVEQHLNRRGFSTNRQQNYLEMNEAAAHELYDFSKDFLQNAHIQFRSDQLDWQPLSKLEHVLHVQWIDDIIYRNAIVCYSQPIIDENGNIYGYEILSHFTREDGTLIYPNEVFAAAKARGRLYALDRLCRLAAVRYSANLTGKSFINFIPTSIYSPEFCLQSTIKLAKQLGIEPKRFVFEVVESEQVDDVQHLRNILSYYSEKGFQYALDDVGEGYSTLEMLADLEPHYMKLDMKYVQGVSQDFEKQQAARMFLQKALAVGATPLAEGIEEIEDFEWLKAHGYKLFQGYLFGKPSLVPVKKSIFESKKVTL